MKKLAVIMSLSLVCGACVAPGGAGKVAMVADTALIVGGVAMMAKSDSGGDRCSYDGPSPSLCGLDRAGETSGAMLMVVLGGLGLLANIAIAGFSSSPKDTADKAKAPPSRTPAVPTDDEVRAVACAVQLSRLRQERDPLRAAQIYKAMSTPCRAAADFEASNASQRAARK